MLKVQKNIPMPDIPHNVGRPRIYPWYEMEIGDSFLVPTDNARMKKHVVKTGIDKMAKKGLIFELRVVEGGIRVWRTK